MPDTPNLMPQLPAFAWPDPSRIDPVLGVALVTLLAVVAAGVLQHRLRLPRPVGYMLVGALAGPLGFDLIDRGNLGGWKPLVDLAIATLVFELGSRLRPRWLVDNPWLAASCLLEGLLATLAVGGLMAALGAPPLSAVLAGLVAGSSSPIISMASVHELRPHGQVSERMLMMCAINSLVAMLALKLWPLFAIAGSGLGDALTWTASAVYVLCGSFLLGLAAGWLLDRGARFHGHRATMPVLQIALVLLTATLASGWGLSPLLTLLVAGMTARARMRHRLTVEPYLGSAGAVLNVLLFIAIGLLFHVSNLRETWPWVLGLVCARLAGKGLGIALLARPSGLSWRQALALALALQPMGSLVVLLVADNFGWATQLPGVDARVMQTMLAATALLQLTGPLWQQLALRRVAGEAA